MEEMNERSVMKAICCIEQKLLLSDVSPSIHNTVDEAKNDSKQRVGISPSGVKGRTTTSAPSCPPTAS